jgi:hypothetical protein
MKLTDDVAAAALATDAQERLVFSLFTMSTNPRARRPQRSKRISAPQPGQNAFRRLSNKQSGSAGKGLVEPAGIEPATLCLQSRCSPS